MTHATGTRLKSAYDVETLRARCVCDRHTDCWHFRKADGKPFTRGETPKVWLHGGTYATPTRAMWLFHTGKPVQRHLVIYRKCESMDCINPAHLRCGTREVAVRFSTKRAGVSKNSLENLCASRDQRSKLTPELRAWVLESSQSGSEVAHVMGMSQGRINLIRQQARQSLPKAACSIFALGAAMNAPHMRRSA
jgi:hypothetical protein